jgi:ribose transport system permease protein
MKHILDYIQLILLLILLIVLRNNIPLILLLILLITLRGLRLFGVVPATGARRRTTMKQIFGILVIVWLFYGAFWATGEPARSLEAQQNLARRVSFYGVLTLGAALVIITGGIDLSMGSVVGLSAVCFALLLRRGISPVGAAAIVLACSPIIGLIHGLLITKLRLQPFLVTLCGLLIYRGLARWATWERGTSQSVGLGGLDSASLTALKFLVRGSVAGIPVSLFLFLGLACFVAVLLHGSVAGRYLYAIGANEQAARYAGIATDRYKILAYMFCSLTAGLGGVMEMLEVNTANPAVAGSWYELYAITGAVLGGCSLSGGEGTVPGIVLGAAVSPLLRDLCRFSGLPDDLVPTFIGAALLLGTITDEVLKRRAARRR